MTNDDVILELKRELRDLRRARVQAEAADCGTEELDREIQSCIDSLGAMGVEFIFAEKFVFPGN